MRSDTYVKKHRACMLGLHAAWFNGNILYTFWIFSLCIIKDIDWCGGWVWLWSFTQIGAAASTRNIHNTVNKKKLESCLYWTRKKKHNIQKCTTQYIPSFFLHIFLSMDYFILPTIQNVLDVFFYFHTIPFTYLKKKTKKLVQNALKMFFLSS